MTEDASRASLFCHFLSTIHSVSKNEKRGALHFPPRIHGRNFPNSEEKIGPELAQPAKKFLKD